MLLGELIAKIGADTSKLRVGQQEATFLYKKIGTSAGAMEDAVRESWSSIGKYALGVVGAIYSINKAFSQFESVARRNDIKMSFDNLARNVGVNSNKLISSLISLSGGTIDTFSAMQAASRALLFSLDTETIQKMMQIAYASTKITGKSIVSAFDDITLGVARQSKMILDNLGLLLDYDKHLLKLQSNLGKLEADLSDADRRQAFLNATFEAGDEIIRKVGDSFGSTYDQINQQKATIRNLTEEIKSMTFESGVYLGVLKQTHTSLSQIKGLGAVFGKALDIKNSAIDKLFDFIGGNKFLDWYHKVDAKTGDFTNSLLQATPRIKKFKDELFSLFGIEKEKPIIFENLSDRIKNLQFRFPVEFDFMAKFEAGVDDSLNRVDNKIKKTDDLLKKMGTTTKEGLAFKTKELQKEAEVYRQARVDEVLIDQWYYGEIKKNLQAFISHRASSIEKIQEKDIITSSEIKKAYEEMYSALGVNSKKYYTFRSKLLEEQRKEEIFITGDVTLAWEAYYARLKELDAERIRHTGTAAEGVKLFFEEDAKGQQSWASETERGMGELKQNMKDTSVSIIRRTESISDAFKNMALSILDSIARIATNRMVDSLFGSLGNLFNRGGSSLGSGTGTIGSSYTGGAGSAVSSGGGINYNGMTGFTGYSRKNEVSSGETTIINNYNNIEATDADSFVKLLKRNRGALNEITLEGKRKNRNFEKSLASR